METLKINNAIPYIILLSIGIMDIIIIAGIINVFWGWNTTMIAGVLAFIGAIIGGSLTLIGVTWTLTSQYDEDIQRKKDEHRTYLSASTIDFNFTDDEKYARKENHRIIITDSWCYRVSMKTFHFTLS